MWSSTNLSLPENLNLQHQWDEIKSSSRSVALRPLHRLACLSSATQPNCGAWMNSLSSTAIGTLQDNESFRIAVIAWVSRLCPTQMPLYCHGRQISPTSSLVPLQRWSFTTTHRIDDIIKRAFSSAVFNAVLEPVDLDRGDGKRPDGMTVFPISRGKCLIWDSTCVDSSPPLSIGSDCNRAWNSILLS